MTQTFWGYRCESGIVDFAWRDAWNYAYSPFNIVAGWLISSRQLEDLKIIKRTIKSIKHIPENLAPEL